MKKIARARFYTGLWRGSKVVVSGEDSSRMSTGCQYRKFLPGTGTTTVTIASDFYLGRNCPLPDGEPRVF